MSRTARLTILGLLLAGSAGGGVARVDFFDRVTYQPGGDPAGLYTGLWPACRPRSFRLSGGETLQAGAGRHTSGKCALQSVREDGDLIRYTFSGPEDGIALSFVFGDQRTTDWAAGRIEARAPLELTARKGGATAVLVVRGVVAEPDRLFPTNRGERGHLPLARPGTPVSIHSTYTLPSGTWSASQFTREFQYHLTGYVEFAASSPPTDHPVAPAVHFASWQMQVAEGDVSAEVRLAVSEPLVEPLIVELSPTGFAAAGVDYVIEHRTITMPAGATSASVRVDFPADEVREAEEDLLLEIVGAAPGTVASRPFLFRIQDRQPDVDRDGLPDAWETRHAGSATAMRAADDADRDGWSNLQEFQRGADPKVRQVVDAANGMGLEVWTPLLAGARHPVVPDADRPEEQVLRAEQELASRPGDLSVELQRSPTSGLVLAKRIRGRTEQTYAYRANGQMRAQADADGVTTELEFDALGDVSGMSYSDGTPPVSIIHTRLGQLAALRSAGVEVTYGYDSSRLVQLRRTGSNVLSHVCAYTYTNAHSAQIACDLAAGSWSNRIEYDYGPGARIRELRDRDLVVRYSIGVGLVLADVTIGRRQGPPLLSLHQQWDGARELVVERRWQVPQGTGLVYTVARHPTTRRVESARWSDGVEWTYRYDQAQHLSAAACRRTLDFGSFPLFTHGYAWNSAGDPTLAGPVRNGVSVGNAFDSDPLNLLVQREWEPFADVWGRVQEDPLITVSVNDQACLRLGPWFHCRLALDPAPAADTVPVTVRAVRGAQIVEQTGFLRRPASVEKPLYSRAGTLVKDSQYRYRHDARGNLLALEPLGVGVAPRLAFTYYPDGLRATKSVFTWSGQAWTLARRHRYAYDRMCLVYEEIAELRDGKSTAWTREYLWGLDQADQASGSFRQEAGGVGGLVAVKVRRGASCRLLIPMCDAHGNIVRLFDADRQEMAAEFTYTPFGEMVGCRVGEPALADFPLRFRSQYYDVETGLYYMGNRYYDPRTTKWLTSTRSAWEKVPAGNATGFSGGNPLL